jgi:predicted transglutaminase-like cysteine proteinase
MRKPLLALLLIALPCAAPAFDMHAQLRGWKYAMQLLDGYPVRTHSRPIANFEAKLVEIHRNINAVPYVNDASEYGEESFWLTPVQFYQTGGECRDYAVASYYAGYAMGLADSEMWFVAVRVKSGKYKGQFHAILLVKHAGRTYVLDNLHSNVRPASSMADYQPIYFINRLGYRTVQ